MCVFMSTEENEREAYNSIARESQFKKKVFVHTNRRKMSESTERESQFQNKGSVSLEEGSVRTYSTGFARLLEDQTILVFSLVHPGRDSIIFHQGL